MLDEDEMARLIKAAKGWDDERRRRGYPPNGGGALMIAAMTTGARIGELLCLRWKAVHWDDPSPVVAVYHTMTRGVNGGWVEKSTTKTPKGHRELPLMEVAVVAFERWHKLTPSGAANDLVWPSETGRYHSHTVARNILHRLCKMAEIEEPWPSPHSCRLGFSTMAMRAGVSAVAIADLLGHSDPALVFATYSHAATKDRQQVMGEIERRLRMKPKASPSAAAPPSRRPEQKRRTASRR
jgi:integrase